MLIGKYENVSPAHHSDDYFKKMWYLPILPMVMVLGVIYGGFFWYTAHHDIYGNNINSPKALHAANSRH